jgi:hypothetical protein
MNGTALVTAFLGFAAGIGAAKGLSAAGPKSPRGRRVLLLSRSLMPLAVVLILATSDPRSSSRTTHAVLFAIEMAMITIGLVCTFAGLSITTKQRRETSSSNHDH